MMKTISKIILKNFMSWEDVEIDLDPGFNVICGESDKGKSAIVWAIRWIMKNRPLGDDFCSDWIKKETKSGKTKFTGITEATMIFSDGSFVTRAKGKNTNEYRVNTKKNPIEAFGTEVPDKVLRIINMSDLNFQDQFHPFFLLDDKPPEIGKKINSISNLSDIDKLFKFIDSRIRENNRTIKSNEKIIEDKTIELKNFDWVEPSQKLFKKVKQFIDEADAIEFKISKMQNAEHKIKRIIDKRSKLKSIDDLGAYEAEIRTNIEKANGISDNIQSALKMRSRLSKIMSKRDRLLELDKISDLSWKIDQKILLIEDIEKELDDRIEIEETILDLEKKLSIIKNISKYDKKFNHCDGLIKSYQKLIKERDLMIKIETKAIDLQKKIEIKTKEISKLTKDHEELMGDTCPLCGK